MGELSPMMQQYMDMKKQYEGALLFFRLGDFYELFFEDARTASRELELVLTGRDCGLKERAPMCGVPFHSYEGYVAKLVAKGYKIAICEQMEDPALAKGLVKREVVRVITPGTIIESYMLDEGKHNYIGVVNLRGDCCGACFADVSTGEINCTELSGSGMIASLCAELSRFMPSELLLSESCSVRAELVSFIKERLGVESVETYACSEEYDAFEHLKEALGEECVAGSGLSSHPAAAAAVYELMTYLTTTQKTGLERMDSIVYYEGEQYLKIDPATRRNLELTETMRTREKHGSLLGVIDKTRTAMGKRLLRTWFERPLISPTLIHARLNALDELMQNSIKRSELIEVLSSICDIERLMTRVVCASANARELRALCSAIGSLPALCTLLGDSRCRELKSALSQLDLLEDVYALIDNGIAEEPPVTVREGNLIRPGYNEEIDSIRSDMTGGKDILAALEQREREKTGISKLKIGYNRVFGYYIEVSNSFKSQVPETYIRKQTLAGGERYITQELKTIEGRVLGAQDRLLKLEYQVFEKIRAEVAKALPRVQRTASAIARIDVYCSFAEVSARNNYTRPNVDSSGRILLKNSRHPVVESLSKGSFVPNDVMLDKKDNRIAIITGPNMAGKSTYMRQVALIVFMAQLGCFVPAENADIGVVDSIFTRVGASDDLASGQSTFMVEMNEVAYILKNATADSLLVLDEIGRGTSTFDGMSIARAVLEYVADKRKLGAKALFATHYHELTVLEEQLTGVKNYNIAVKKHGDDITFLRRIVRGGADDSYGIEVAKLAGLPDWVIQKAKQVLSQLEDGQQEAPRIKKRSDEQLELPLIPPGESEAIRRLKELDINSLTPMDALRILDELSKLAN